MLKSVFKPIMHVLEAIVVYILYAIIWLMPIDWSSAFFGYLLRFVGPYISHSKIARKNIRLCFPDMSAEEVECIVKDSWENLGRIIGEAPHLASLSPRESRRRLKVDDAFKEAKKPCLFLSGHIGNFEAPCKLSMDHNLDLNLIYRPANNKLVNWMIKFLREKNGNKLIPKGNSGLKKMIDIIKDGRSIGLLVDQKMNEGIDAKFFGQVVKTTPMPAKVSLKYNVPIYMAFVRRLKGAHFKVEVLEIDTKKYDDVKKLTQHINDVLEEWVRKEPGQWFWIHNRFK